MLKDVGDSVDELGRKLNKAFNEYVDRLEFLAQSCSQALLEYVEDQPRFFEDIFNQNTAPNDYPLTVSISTIGRFAEPAFGAKGHLCQINKC